MANNFKLSKTLFFLVLFLVFPLTVFAEEGENKTPSDAEITLEENALHQQILDYIDDYIYGRVPVKDYHKPIHQNGSSCELCHGSKEPTTPADPANCANCHGSPSDVAELTKDKFEHNPHDSPHWETELPCDMCHKEHSESVSACQECHQFDFQTP